MGEANAQIKYKVASICYQTPFHEPASVEEGLSLIPRPRPHRCQQQESRQPEKRHDSQGKHSVSNKIFSRLSGTETWWKSLGGHSRCCGGIVDCFDTSAS